MEEGWLLKFLERLKVSGWWQGFVIGGVELTWGGELWIVASG